MQLLRLPAREDTRRVSASPRPKSLKAPCTRDYADGVQLSTPATSPPKRSWRSARDSIAPDDIISAFTCEATYKLCSSMNRFGRDMHSDDDAVPPQQHASPSRTVGEMQSAGMPQWMANDDLIEGWQFCATIQLRTPLRVLRWHRNVVHDKHNPPPRVTREPWEGIWLPKTKSLQNSGFNTLPGTMASEIGPIPLDGGDYLKFLIALRGIVETQAPLSNRIAGLRKELSDPHWSSFVKTDADLERFVHFFFPYFLSTIPKMNRSTMAQMREEGLSTPERIASASDQTLLSIRGIGPALLKLIREWCARAVLNRDSDRIDTVYR